MMERSLRNGGGERRMGWRWAVALVLIAGGAAGCDSIFEVDNPNDLVQEDLEQPTASTALVNGAEATVARGLADIVLAISVPSDELTWRGTYDAGRELDAGFLSNPTNEFSNAEAWGTFAMGRFMADEAVRLMERWQAEGTLRDPSHLARAYLYSAIAYVAAADYWDSYVISDRHEAAPPAKPRANQPHDQPPAAASPARRASANGLGSTGGAAAAAKRNAPAGASRSRIVQAPSASTSSR